MLAQLLFSPSNMFHILLHVQVITLPFNNHLHHQVWVLLCCCWLLFRSLPSFFCVLPEPSQGLWALFTLSTLCVCVCECSQLRPLVLCQLALLVLLLMTAPALWVFGPSLLFAFLSSHTVQQTPSISMFHLCTKMPNHCSSSSSVVAVHVKSPCPFHTDTFDFRTGIILLHSICCS